jgi:hypothetical protein
LVMQESTVKNNVSKGKRIKFIFFTLLFLFAIIFIIAEVLLALFGYPSNYKKMQTFSLTQAKWWTCDSVNGPRYVPNQLGQTDADFFKNEKWYYNRLSIVNNEGYHDRDNFTEVSSASDSLKILFAGDSFTWGASADVDSSYVDVFESDVKKAYPGIVWNTGVPATGTNHAIFTTKKYLPLQKSNYVVLGFYVANDFNDNLLPFDRLVFNNLASCYNLYDYDKNFKPFKISKSEAYKKATGSYPMEELNVLQKILIRSRFISFIGDMKAKVVNRLSGNKGRTTEQEYKMTAEYLKQLNDYVKENNAELIVCVIPQADDIKEKGTRYLNVIKILNGLSVKYFENTSLFTAGDYLKTGGGHWKNSGHIKAGHGLSKYLLEYIKERQQKTFQKK